MSEPLRVLEVIYRADRAGTEIWLVNLLRNFDRRRIAMDFLVHDRTQGACDEEIRQSGARIFAVPGHRNLVRQLHHLRRIQRDFGPYDVIHSHVDYYGGIVALSACLAGVRARVTHSHNDTRLVDRGAGLFRRFYILMMKALIRAFSTAGAGTSPAAAAMMFGAGWRSDRRWRVIPACTDLRPFCGDPSREAVRKELGLPGDALVFGHVGRFVDQKNHEFLMQVAEAVARREPRAVFLWVGGGPLRPGIEAEIQKSQFRDRFILLSPRNDVARLMLGAMDFFLFPSRYEGLGLALIEAQAAGLRCFASDSIPSEALPVPQLVTRLPLASGPQSWADAILAETRQPVPVSRRDAWEAANGRFNIAQNAAVLAGFYREITA